MRICVLISGKAGAGKTTIGDYIAKQCGFKKVSFGSGVKYYAKKLGWNGKKDFFGRFLLQFIGKIGRAYRKSFWVDKQFKAKNIEKVVVDDWRFPDELDSCKKYFDKIIKIRIIRNNTGTGYKLLDMDVSETSLDKFNDYDCVICNYGTLDELYSKVDEVICQKLL